MLRGCLAFYLLPVAPPLNLLRIPLPGAQSAEKKRGEGSVLFQREQKDTLEASQSVGLPRLCVVCSLDRNPSPLASRCSRARRRPPECVGRIMRRVGELKNRTRRVVEGAETAAG